MVPGVGKAGAVAEQPRTLWLGPMPREIRRLEDQDVIYRLKEAVVAAELARESVEALIPSARLAGLSWDSIGWLVGLSGSGARRRWGGEQP